MDSNKPPKPSREAPDKTPADNSSEEASFQALDPAIETLIRQAFPEGSEVRSEMFNALLRLSQHRTCVYHMPIPPGEELRKIDHVIPGGAERILGMAEKEQAHRHGMDRSAVFDGRMGQCFAFILAVLFIVVGGGLIYLGHPFTGTFFTSGVLIALISVFIKGWRYYSKSSPEGERDAASGADEDRS